jgi:hypothetical protein
MLRRVSFAALILALAFAVATPALAQTTTGVISGIITDAQGGVLPGVTVTARNTDTGLLRTAVTEGDGRFRFAALPPGPYELKAELSGFGPVTVPALTVNTSSETTRNVTMQVVGVQESVTVTGEAPIIEVTKTEVSGVVTQDQMQNLPLSTRQPMDLALLLPGTNQDAARARKANTNIGAGAFTNGSGLLVDGVWNKEGNTGEPRQDFPQSAIQEFKVFLSQSPAEYGWTAGGTVSMATKSGTNQFHGEGFEQFQNQAMSVQDPFSKANGNPKPASNRSQYGGTFGGPIVKDKIHFFQSAEGLDLHQFDTVIVPLPQFYGNLNGTFPSPETNRMTFTRSDVQVSSKQSFFVRYAWQVSNFTCEGCGASSPAPWFGGAGGIKQKRYSLAGAHTWILSPRVLNEFHGQYTNYHFRSHPPGVDPANDLFDNSTARTSPLTQAYSFPSASWGTSGNFYTEHIARELRDDLSITSGSHNVKFGAAFLRNGLWGDNRPALGTWTFSADQPFNPNQVKYDAATLTAGGSTFVPLPGSVRQFTASLLPLPVFTPHDLLSEYVQDEWKPTLGVTVNIGLRYDYEFHAFNQGISASSKDFQGNPVLPFAGTPLDIAATGVDFSKRGDRKDWGPRAGVAWDLQKNGNTVVRADYGIYYNPTNLGLESSELANFKQLSVTVANPTYPDPYGGRDPKTFVSTAPQNIQVMANDLKMQRSIAYSGGVSQSLSSDIAIHVDGIYNKMDRYPMAVDINARPGAFSNATLNFVATGARPLPQFARVYQNQSIGWANYKAMYVRLEKRFDKRYMYLISYTLSASRGLINSSSTSATIVNAGDLNQDVGPNNSDRRHALVASGSVQLPATVMLATVFTYRSTMPFSAVAGIDINGDSATTDYVPGTTRNIFNRGSNDAAMAAVNAWRATNRLAPLSASQLDTNEYYDLDLRVSKQLSLGGGRKLELSANMFNVLNRTNLLFNVNSSIITNALAPNFGQIQSALNKRQAQLGVRFTF